MVTVNVVERCHKETEQTLAVEQAAFLQQPITYFKKEIEQFLYIGANEFETVKMDAVVIEFDEMFKVHTALFGLAIQKKYSQALKTYLRDNLKGMLGSSSAMFNGDEGLWEVNIAFEAMEGFTGEETIEQAIEKLIAFVSTMLKDVVGE
jgi:hypothetical protein